ncbi:MAG: sugar ABC transporter permease [Chloroflexi bacterium]|nr:sugar ABC transporter permease [Chloroflexota bacterium]
MKRNTFLLFVSPSVIIMVLLMILPVLGSLYLSFNLITLRNLLAPVWNGFDNYQRVLNDSAFWDSIKFTLFYVAVTVPTTIVLGYILALMLDQVTLFRGVLIGAMLLPMVITPVVSTLMFRDMFDKTGLYYYLLKVLFDYKFILNSTTAPILIILHTLWGGVTFPMIVLFAGLQSQNIEIIEAAMVDGANWFQRLIYVVTPQLRSLFIFITLISIMDSYRVYDSIFVITGGNPTYKATSVILYTISTATAYGNLGRANAMAILTVIGIFVVLIPYLVRTYHDQLEER